MQIFATGVLRTLWTMELLRQPQLAPVPSDEKKNRVGVITHQTSHVHAAASQSQAWRFFLERAVAKMQFALRSATAVLLLHGTTA